MDFRAYQQEAKRTGGRDLLPENRDKGLNCAALGLCGESGEFADHVKKAQHHRLGIDADREAKMKKELGDVLWYLAHACNVMGWSLDEIASLNVAKLRARYPEGFSPAASVAKADEGSQCPTCGWPGDLHDRSACLARSQRAKAADEQPT
jgi:NTP pyrophosphatase (non-canonical NTP hydrolase)